MAKQIETDRLLLRPFRAAGADVVAEQIGDFEVSTWLTRAPRPCTRAPAFFDTIADEKKVFVVCRDETPMGCVSVMGDHGARHREQGLAIEAAQAVVDTCLSAHEEALESGYIEGNTRPAWEARP